MVDFNNDQTITGRNATDILRVIIMERRYNLFEAVERYELIKEEGQDVGREFSVVKARAYTMYLELQQIIKRRLKPADIIVFLSNLKANNYSDILLAIGKMNDILDDINLTKLDNKKVYDKTRVEEENKAKNM